MNSTGGCGRAGVRVRQVRPPIKCITLPNTTQIRTQEESNKEPPTRGWGREGMRNRPVSRSWTNPVGITNFGQWPRSNVTHVKGDSLPALHYVHVPRT